MFFSFSQLLNILLLPRPGFLLCFEYLLPHLHCLAAPPRESLGEALICYVHFHEFMKFEKKVFAALLVTVTWSYYDPGDLESQVTRKALQFSMI